MRLSPQLKTIRTGLGIAAIVVGSVLVTGQYVTDRFSSVQVLHWAPTWLIPLFGVLSVLLGNTNTLKKISCVLCFVAVTHWCVHDWKPKGIRGQQQEPINFLHWTVEEFDQSRAQETLKAAKGFETDFLCLVNINTLLKLPWKEQLNDLPYQKV